MGTCTARPTVMAKAPGARAIVRPAQPRSQEMEHRWHNASPSCPPSGDSWKLTPLSAVEPELGYVLKFSACLDNQEAHETGWF
eukprot:gene34553-18025_t